MNKREFEWRVIGASAIGTSHLDRAIQCQDSFRQMSTPAGDRIVVVADGAGSAALAGLGSQIAAESASTWLHNHLCNQPDIDENALEVALLLSADHARIALEAKAGEGSLPLRDFATTLIVVCVTQRLIGAVQLGDGGIVIRNRSGVTGLLISPVRSGYINEADFLTMPHFSSYLRVGIASVVEVSGFSVFTDGIEFLSVGYFNCIPSNQFFEPLFDFACSPESTNGELEDFLKNHPVFATVNDDKTLVLAVSA